MPKPEKFEVALKKLEVIVTRLEEGNLPLEESLKSFEEGMKLAKSCQERLSDFRKKIELLMKDGKRRDFEVE